MINMPLGVNEFFRDCSLAAAIFSEDGLVVEWNGAAERMFGWRREELIGGRVPGLALKDGVELEVQRKDGALIHVSVWTAPTENGERVSLFGDATERHDVRGLLRTMNRFRELLEAAPDAILEVDSDGKILLMNAITEEMFGFSRDELLGQTVDVLIPEELRMRHEAHRQNYVAKPVRRPMGTGLTLEGRRKDGSRFPIEISLSPVNSAEGRHVSAIIRDVSDRKRVEERLREVQDKFTTELAEANRELERANRLKSEFLASMSHELRTPLHTIIGFSELMAEELDGPLNEKQKRFVGHIRRDSFHLLELINDVLDLSKIEAGKLDLHAEIFDGASAVDEVLSSVASMAIGKAIAITDGTNGPLMVHADRVRFKQIIYNLLSNAVKFTSAGGRILIDASVNKGIVEFSIRDTGIGIPKAEQSAIFNKFHQVGSTTAGVREGTGLGLAITRHLVERHGGRIWVESEGGNGSCFRFTVPAG